MNFCLYTCVRASGTWWRGSLRAGVGGGGKKHVDEGGCSCLTRGALLLALSSFKSGFLTFFLMPLCAGILAASSCNVTSVIAADMALLVCIFALGVNGTMLEFYLSSGCGPSGIFDFTLGIVFIKNKVLAVFAMVY